MASIIRLCRATAWVAPFVLLSVLFASCDPSCTWEHYVANECDSQIFVRYWTYNQSLDTTVLALPPGERILVAAGEQRGKFVDGPNEHFLNNFFGVFEVLRDTVSLSRIRKDVSTVDSWNYMGEKEGYFGALPVGTHRYTLTIGSNDY